MKLATYLKRQGLTVEEFAEQSGVSRATLFRVEKSGARTASVIRKIVRASAGAVTAFDLIPRSAA